MVLPEGKHSVEFKFEPKVFIVGEKISRISSIVLLILVVAALGWGIKDFLAKKV